MWPISMSKTLLKDTRCQSESTMDSNTAPSATTSEPSLRVTQVADLAWMMGNERGLILHDPGVGKTPPVCVYMWWQWNENKKGTCWVMPKSLLKKNKAELLRFTQFKDHEIVIIDGEKKKREEQIAHAAPIYLMGFQRFSEDWRRFKQLYPFLDIIIVDESQLGYINWDSKRTKELYQATLRDFRYFFVMTGTIIKGKLSSAFPAIHIIEPRYYGSYGGFLNHHAIRDEWGTIIGWQNHDKLSRIFQHHAIRRTFADEYGKEAKVIQVHDIEMSDKHAKAYKEWHDKAMLELENEELLSAPNAAVHAMRARQILAHPETFLIPELHGLVTERDERLMTEFEDIKHAGERYVTFSCFVPEVERINQLAKKVGLRSEFLHGGVSSAKRADRELAFREGRIDHLSVNPQVAGIGYNWPFLQRLGFASLDYGDDSFFQAYRRGIRGIRDTALAIQVFGYKNTIDWRLRSIIEQKSFDAHKVDSSVEVLRLNNCVTP